MNALLPQFSCDVVQLALLGDSGIGIADVPRHLVETGAVGGGDGRGSTFAGFGLSGTGLLTLGVGGEGVVRDGGGLRGILPLRCRLGILLGNGGVLLGHALVLQGDGFPAVGFVCRPGHQGVEPGDFRHELIAVLNDDGEVVLILLCLGLPMRALAHQAPDLRLGILCAPGECIKFLLCLRAAEWINRDLGGEFGNGRRAGWFLNKGGLLGGEPMRAVGSGGNEGREDDGFHFSILPNSNSDAKNNRHRPGGLCYS